MSWRTVGTSASILVGLAVAGSLVGPAWDPEPLRDPIVPSVESTEIGGTEAAALAGQLFEPGTFEIRESTHTIALDEYEVNAILREPVGIGFDAVAIVFVHGAGTGRAYEAFVEQATQLASAGIVTLVPDKRLDTYTTWHRDYEQMARDYLHSFEFLRALPGVDPERVGVYGESEGAWIVPIMQVFQPSIAFTIQASAPVLPPRAQAAFAVDNFLRNVDVPNQIFRAIPRALGIPFPLGILEYADFDVTPWLRQQSAPILMLYGAADPSMPIDQGARKVIAETAIGGRGAPVTVRYYYGADHGLRVDGIVVPDVSRDIAAWAQGLPETAYAEPRIAGAQPEQMFLATSVPSPVWWVNGNVVLGSVIAGIILLLLGPFAWLVRWLVVRRRGSGTKVTPAETVIPANGGADDLPEGFAYGYDDDAYDDAPGGEADWDEPDAGTVKHGRFARRIPGILFGIGAGSFLTLAALIVYLMAVAVLSVNYAQHPALVQFGWLGVRLLGLITVIFMAMMVERVREVRESRRTGDRKSLVVSGWEAHLTLWSTLIGSGLLMLWLTYWGVFQLGI